MSYIGRMCDDCECFDHLSDADCDCPCHWEWSKHDVEETPDPDTLTTED